MRILMAGPVPSRREGGTATTIYNLGEELQKKGHEVTNLFFEDLLPKGTPARFADLRFARAVDRYITERRDQFDVVNLHAPSGSVYGARRKLGGGRGLPPYVMTLHGSLERRIGVYDQEARKGRQANWTLKNRLWYQAYHASGFRLAIATADGANVCSRDVWNILQMKYDIPADRTAYTPWGVNERFFVPRTYEDGRPLKLLYVGSWLEQRGVHYLREALPRLAARLPGLTMSFVGCGAPEEQILGFFGPALASTIRVVPTIPSGEVHRVFAEHDVFLFPSLLEGLPSVLLEAMASGMPVITTETCGMPDVVEDGLNGLLVPPGDSDAIEAAVLRLAADAALRRRLGETAQQTMRRYTWKRAAETLEKLFQHVIATR
jgi:glycosyltransferase involved in cell wall biosynthesis